MVVVAIREALKAILKLGGDRPLEHRDGRPPDPPIHGIWARRATGANAPRKCEFLLNEHRDGEWLYRHNEAVTRPLQEVGDERDGVPFLRPEIAVLYKAAERSSAKNDTDFSRVRLHLSREARLWLLAALVRCDDRHP